VSHPDAPPGGRRLAAFGAALCAYYAAYAAVFLQRLSDYAGELMARFEFVRRLFH
jgi:hypothetical protein